IFPDIGWQGREWSSVTIDRAEPVSDDRRLPPGPAIQQRGKVYLCWPVKLTFAPLLSDMLLRRFQEAGIYPNAALAAALPDFASPPLRTCPWEEATWKKI